MKRTLLTLALVAAAVLAATTPDAANAQYGYYGTFSGGGQNYRPHVRSLQPYVGVYPAIQPVFGYGYAPNVYAPNVYAPLGNAPYGNSPYGYAPNGYAPYGGYRGGYNGGGNCRW